MLNQEMCVLYETNDSRLQAEVDKEAGELDFFVESQGYSGMGDIYLEKEAWGIAYHSLSKMYHTLKGEFLLEDRSDGRCFLKFYFEGRILMVKGRFQDYFDNKLEFIFRADQTLLGLLLVLIKKML